jgi:outer membrane protein
MMTSLFRPIVAAVIIAVVAGPSAFAQTTPSASSGGARIAYINSQKILAEAPGRAEAEATYDRERGMIQAQLQQLDDSLKTMFAALQKEAPTLDSAKRTAREKAFGDRRASYQTRAQALNEQMQQRQADLARPLMDQVSKVLDEFRTKGGYAMIFDVGTPSSVVVSADKSLDLTDQVLARLKQLGPPTAAASSSAPPPGPTSTPTGVKRPQG